MALLWPTQHLSSIWLSRPAPTMAGSVPRERGEAHKVSWGQALNSHTVTLLHSICQGKSQAQPRFKVWQNGFCLFMEEAAKSSHCKGRGRECWLYLQSASETSNPSKQKMFLCGEFNLGGGEEFFPTLKGWYKSKRIHQVKQHAVDPNHQFSPLSSAARPSHSMKPSFSSHPGRRVCRTVFIEK